MMDVISKMHPEWDYGKTREVLSDAQHGVGEFGNLWRMMSASNWPWQTAQEFMKLKKNPPESRLRLKDYKGFQIYKVQVPAFWPFAAHTVYEIWENGKKLNKEQEQHFTDATSLQEAQFFINEIINDRIHAKHFQKNPKKEYKSYMTPPRFKKGQMVTNLAGNVKGRIKEILMSPGGSNQYRISGGGVYYEGELIPIRENPAVARQFSDGRTGQKLFDPDEYWLHPELKSRLERALGLGIGDQIGCGSFGCAYETSDSNKVVKISTDINEGPAAWAIVSNRFVHPGIVHIYTVFSLERVNNPAYCLVTERLESVRSMRRVWNQIAKARWVESFESWRDEAMAYVELQGEIMGNYGDIAKVTKGLRDLYHFFKDYPEVEPMLCGICTLSERYGIIIADIHAGNYGLRPNDELVKWSTGANYQPLVLLDVGFASYPKEFGHVPGKSLRRNPPQQQLLRPDLLRGMPDITDFL